MDGKPRLELGVPYQADADGREAARRALALIDDGRVELPEEIRAIARRAAEILSRGDGLIMGSVGQQITTQRAADILNVSRQHLVKMLEDGEIPHTKVGSHRRVLLADVLDRKRRRHEGFMGFVGESDKIMGDAASGRAGP